MNPLPRDVVVRWMSFTQEGERILALRRQTHSDLGRTNVLDQTPHDATGFHLGAFMGNELVAVLSAVLFEQTMDFLPSYGLPKSPRVVELMKFAELRAYRGTRIAELLMVTMHRMIFEVLRPQYIFALSLGGGNSNAGVRWPDVGWEVSGTISDRLGEVSVLWIPATQMEHSYRRARKVSERLWNELDTLPQSLVKHLDVCGRMDMVARASLLSENMHTVSAASLKDELPRLSAQTRLLFAEQKPRVASVDFPKPPARLLDVGSGPGVYLAALGKTEKFQGYELIGVDVSKEMVMYARLNRSDIKWLHANAYDTKQADASIDVVHLAFVMVHLMSPALALREFARILRPGGLLYLVDVNDSTFRGGDAMKALIEAYDDLTPSDRNVMNLLPRLALEWGFELRHRF
ncbi:MAG TPA: methyltransferase domain-containing protein, partial [Polyangium sp.]|nr:methyltransferase domain-containing protein [Polyangium sp.]